MRFNWARVFDSVLIGTVCLLALLVRKEALLSARLQAHLGSDRVTFATTNQHDPIYQPAAFSKSSRHRNAYASLCFGDTTIDGTLVLFTGLRSVAARADFVAMTHNLSATGLARLSRHGIRIVPVQPLHADRFYMTSKKSASIEERDAILWTKLRAWELTDYDKVIMMDADLLVLENVDELFLMPEVAASALIHVSEKISFFKSSEYGMVPGNKVNRQSREASLLEGWSGLNSGVTVLKPSNETFSKLLSELSIIPNRPCCPSQVQIDFSFSGTILTQCHQNSTGVHL
ncbi:nucleotide-diphospho-sugar transferase [Chytriomyces sp. MP71]|nr:nucleotide-diphospho-sugar transferase [Chytriomyces sp. MP71]